MLETLLPQDHYAIRCRILRAINPVTRGADRVQYFKLYDALQTIYGEYDSACVEARARPSIKKAEFANAILERYRTLENDIMTSLVYARLFADDL